MELLKCDSADEIDTSSAAFPGKRGRKAERKK